MKIVLIGSKVICEGLPISSSTGDSGEPNLTKEKSVWDDEEEWN